MMTRTHKLLYLTTTLAIALLAAGQHCPDKYPFAYDNGNHCCKNNRENQSPIKDLGCDGGLISICSTCCKGDEFVKCPQPPCENAGMCTTDECKEASRSLFEFMNPDADPCIDFHEFACGKFMKEKVLPADKNVFNSADTPLVDNIYKRGKQLLEEVPKVVSPFKTDGLARAYYKSCMDESAIEKADLSPLKKMFKDLGGMPAIEGANWNGKGFQWWDLVPKLSKYGLFFWEGIIMWFIPFLDFKNNKNMVLYMDQPFGSGGDMGHSVLIQGFTHKIVRSYYEYMVDAAKLMGAENETAHKDVKEALQFEIDLAHIVADPAQRGEGDLYNKRTIKDLEGQPGYPPNLTGYINKIFSYAGTPEVKVHEDDTIIVRRVNYAKNLSDLLSRTSSRAVANYIFLRTYQSVQDYLGKSSRSLRQEYLRKIDGVQKLPPRWQHCVHAVGFNEYTVVNGGALNLAAASLYARKHLSHAVKNKVESMVVDVQNGFKQLLEDNDWMDCKTKIHGIQKIDAIRKHIGYQKEILDHNVLNEFFKDLNLTDSFFHNHLELDKFWTRYRYRKYLKPRKHDETHFAENQDIVTPNSRYYPWTNSLKIAAGSIQGLYFNIKFPMSLNYGGFGSYVGNFLSSGFNRHGFHFDKDGKFSNWVGNATLQEYKKRSKCFIKKYGNYKVLGININGTKTLNENIQDDTAVKAAYLAYRKYEKEHGPQKLLVGHNLNHRQLFWLRRAQLYCTLSTVESLTVTVNESINPPDRVRVWGSFSNNYDFAKDYECSACSKMNPPDKCHVY